MSREYRRTPPSRRTAGDTSMQSGNSKSYYVFIIVGIILGLMLAIGVYVFINHAPTPFVNKTNQTVAPDLGKVSLDQNQTTKSDSQTTQQGDTSPEQKNQAVDNPPDNQQNNATNGENNNGSQNSNQTNNATTNFEFYKILQDTDNPVQVDQPKPKPAPAPKQNSDEDVSPPPKKETKPEKPAPVKETHSPEPPPVEKEPVAAPAKVVEKSISTQQASAKEIYYIQCGAFQSEKEANNLKTRLGQLGLFATINTKTNEKGTLHRVRVGPYKHIEDVAQDREMLESNSVPQTLVKIKITDSH